MFSGCYKCMLIIHRPFLLVPTFIYSDKRVHLITLLPRILSNTPNLKVRRFTKISKPFHPLCQDNARFDQFKMFKFTSRRLMGSTTFCSLRKKPRNLKRAIRARVRPPLTVFTSFSVGRGYRPWCWKSGHPERKQKVACPQSSLAAPSPH